jgi:hypothetical protein
MVATTHQCKDLSNRYNHCNIYGHIEEKCWKLHPEIKPKNHKKDAKKNNIIAMYLSNHVECNSNVDDNILCTLVRK